MSTEKYVDVNICVKSTKLSSLNVMVHSDHDSLKIGNGTYKIVWKCLNWNYQKFNFKIILKDFSKTHSKVGGILGSYQYKSPRLFSKSKKKSISPLQHIKELSLIKLESLVNVMSVRWWDQEFYLTLQCILIYSLCFMEKLNHINLKMN